MFAHISSLHSFHGSRGLWMSRCWKLLLQSPDKKSGINFTVHVPHCPCLFNSSGKDRLVVNRLMKRKREIYGAAFSSTSWFRTSWAERSIDFIHLS